MKQVLLLGLFDNDTNTCALPPLDNQCPKVTPLWYNVMALQIKKLAAKPGYQVKMPNPWKKRGVIVPLYTCYDTHALMTFGLRMLSHTNNQ